MPFARACLQEVHLISKPLDEIKEIPIQEVARRLGLEVKGQLAHCFSHKPDRNPSLRLNLNKNQFHCYVCRGVGGSVIDLVMQVLGLDFKEAISFLQEGRERYSSERVQERVKAAVSIDPERKSELLQAFMNAAPVGEAGIQYLASRGIRKEIIEKMKVGYLSPDQYLSAYRRFRDRYGLEILKAAGLTHFYIFAKQQLPFLLFPYYVGGRIRSIQGRCLLTKEEAVTQRVKRFAMTERAAYFYHHDLIAESPVLFICEGEIDTLTILQLGFPAIGSPGTWGFDEHWLDLFAGKTVVLCLDPDPAGEKAAAWVGEELHQRNSLCLKLHLPAGCDINEYIRKGGYIGSAQSGTTQP